MFAFVFLQLLAQCCIFRLCYAGTEIPLSSFSAGKDGFRVLGTSASPIGNSVAQIGDFNGDGTNDFAIGSPGHNSNTGMVIMILGVNRTLNLDVSTFASGEAGFRFIGKAAGDNTGTSVAGAGDINGDGKADILVGAFLADVSPRTNCGVVYVLFGTVGPYSDITFASFSSSLVGFYIFGTVDNMKLGEYPQSISGLGDVNGDSIDDIAVSAPAGNSVYRNGAGVVFVIFGSTGTVVNIDLASLTVSQGVYFGGASSGNSFGRAVAGAGDFNGDGIGDILIGASDYTSSANTGSAGAA